MMIQDMKMEIRECARCIFLWARLFVRILNKDCDCGNLKRLRDRLDEIPNELDDLFQDILKRGIQENSYVVQTLQWILYDRRPLSPYELHLAVHSGTSDTTCIRPWDSEENEAESIRFLILGSSKGLAEMTKRAQRHTSMVPLIHESVRDYLHKTGFGMLAPNLVETLTATTPAYLYKCCCQWMSDGVIKHPSFLDGLAKARSPEANELGDYAGNLFPFLEYCVTNLVYYAEMAYNQAISHAESIKTYPHPQWPTIDNVFATYDDRRQLAPFDTIACIISRKNAPDLLVAELQTGEHDIAERVRHDSELEEALRIAANDGNQKVNAIIFQRCNAIRTAVSSPSIESITRRIVGLVLANCDIEVLQVIMENCPPLHLTKGDLLLSIRSNRVDLVQILLY
jgi:hypothetical protein